MNDPLLSLVLATRNDNYGGMFVPRLELSVNYLVYGLARFADITSLEILIVDWNSDEPVAQALHLSEQAAPIVRFVVVPAKIAHKYNPEGAVFNIPVAFNAGIERSRGKYILHMPADILFTTYSIERLWQILKEEIPLPFEPQKTVMLVKRHIIPHQFQETKASFEELDRYLTLSTNWLGENFINPGIAADFGAMIFAKEIWKEAGGLDERMHGWGKIDSRLGLAASITHPLYELSGLGVVSYDPSISAENAALKLQRANKPMNIDFAPVNKTPGIPNEALEIREAVSGERTPPAVGNDFTDSTPQLTQLARTAVKRSLPFNSLYIKPYLFPLYWFATTRPFHRFCEVVATPDDSRKHLPDFCLVDESASALISALNPSAEIITIYPESETERKTTDHRLIGRQYLNKKSGELFFLRTLMQEIAPSYEYKHKWHPGFASATHHGLVHNIPGDPQTVFDRLENRVTSRPNVDLMLFRPAEFEDPNAALARAVSHMSKNGLLLIDDFKFMLTDSAIEGLQGDFVFSSRVCSSLRMGVHEEHKAFLEYIEKNRILIAERWREERLFGNMISVWLFWGVRKLFLNR